MIAHLKEVWKEYKNVIYLSAGVFVLGMIAGLFSPLSFKEAILSMVVEKVDSVWVDNALLLFFRIFANNIFVGIMMLLLGVTLLFPFIILFMNGMIVSIVIESALSEASVLQILGALIPHAVFELPAFFIAAALSITVGLKLFFRKSFMPKRSFKDVFKKSFYYFINVVVFLFLIAAFVESFITPLIGG